MTSECLERPIPKRTLWTSAGSTIPTMSWRKVQGWQGAYFIQQTAQIWLWPNPSTPEEWAWLELSVDIIQPTLFVPAAKRDFEGQSEGCFESWESWSIDLKIWWLEARYDVPAHRPHLVVLLQDRSSTGVRRLTQWVFIPGLTSRWGNTTLGAYVFHFYFRDHVGSPETCGEGNQQFPVQSRLQTGPWRFVTTWLGFVPQTIWCPVIWAGPAWVDTWCNIL